MLASGIGGVGSSAQKGAIHNLQPSDPLLSQVVTHGLDFMTGKVPQVQSAGQVGQTYKPLNNNWNIS